MTDGFVKLSEASGVLGVNERRVRRYAEKLSDNDRQLSDNEPLRVRLSALALLLNVPVLSEKLTSELSDSDGQSVKILSDNLTQGETIERSADAEHPTASDLRAAVAEARAALLESERDSLREALAREQETARQAMTAQNALAAELAKAREQSAVLIAKTAGAFDPVRIGGSPRRWWQFWKWFATE